MASPDLKFDVNTELSSRRTGMSFQRTRMSADRTLMSVIRTSLSLIGFGFTIAQVFEKLRDQNVITRAAAPRNFGLALVGLGIVMLVLGIVYHLQFMLELRHLREVYAGGRARSRREPFSRFLDADYSAHPSCHRRRGDHQYGVSGWPVRLGEAHGSGLNWRFALSAVGSHRSFEL